MSSSRWSAIRAAIRADDVPAFLAELRRELLDGWLTIGTLHASLQSSCFSKVASPPSIHPWQCVPSLSMRGVYHLQGING